MAGHRRATRGRGVAMRASEYMAGSPAYPDEDDEPASLGRAATVLVIEDDPYLRPIIAMAFARCGYRTVSACDGCQGMRLFETEAPALVVTDIVMPEKDGIATIIEIKRTCLPAKVIAISGGGSTGNLAYLRWAKDLGADEVMAKPFRMSALVAAGQQLLAQVSPQTHLI